MIDNAIKLFADQHMHAMENTQVHTVFYKIPVLFLEQ